mgnify:CR=1 FL=1
MQTVEQFRNAMAGAGLAPPDVIHADGKLHRFTTNGKRSDAAGWYCLHGDNLPAGAFGDWRQGVSHTWCSKDSATMTQEEREAHRQRMQQIQAQREAEQAQRHESARDMAQRQWDSASPAGEHPYLTAKGVQGYGLRQQGDVLLVPLRDVAGTLHSLQTIDASGQKRFLSGAKVQGCYHAIGQPEGCMVVCEGFATGASIHMATGQAVACAMNAGGLQAVAMALHAKYPSLQIVIAADDDHATEGNPGMAAASQAALSVGGMVAVPLFDANRPAKATDFNDLHQLQGLEAVKVCVATAQPVESDWPEPFDAEAIPTAWPEDCLPPGMAEAAKAIAEHAQAPEALAGMAVVAAVAHVAQRLIDARHPKTETMPCSLFILTAAGSGERKSECFKLATNPLAKRERKLREQWKAENQELENEAARAKPKDRDAILIQAPPDPRTIFVDATTQKIENAFLHNGAPAMTLSTDEGGMLLGGYSLKAETRAASLGMLTRLFDGGGVQRDRVGDGQSGFRYGVRFGLFLSAQPIVLRESLADPVLREQGFLPRFLYAAPQSLAGGRFLDASDLSRRASDDARIVDYWDALRRIDEMAVCTDEHGGLLLTTPGMTNDAVEVWLEFYNATEARQAVGNDMDALRPFASRAGELAARVAAVYALWRCCGMDGATPGKTVINVTDMRQAVSLVSYSLDEWRRQGDSAILSATERDARDLLTWMHRKELENVTRSHIAQHGPNALRKMTDRRNAAIDELKRRRWLIEKGGGLAIVKKPETTPATAIPANSANSDNRYQDESSKSSGISSSNCGQLFFAPAMPELKPAFVVDVDASIRNLQALFEASNATEMRGHANG